MATKKVVRTSRYRHLFGTPVQAIENISAIKVGQAQTESTVLKANATFYALPWYTSGSVVVLPTGQKGAVSTETPLILHDETTINDLEFSPFNDHLLATACQNGQINLWTIPQGGLTQNITSPSTKLTNGETRVLSVDFHPLASNLLVSFDSNKHLKFWDLESSKNVLTLPDVHKAMATNLSWNLEGSQCATSCKDKTLRLFDPRANKCISEVADHPGAKGGRVVWMKKKNYIFTCGFGKGSDRQLALYDPRKLDQRLTLQQIDTSSSTLLPLYDEDNGIMFLV